ncbi:MAG: hypothetical protein GC171_04485 [Terrimonas sp.]|nr:hypothetical protein [Terrimonas sp.]
MEMNSKALHNMIGGFGKHLLLLLTLLVGAVYLQAQDSIKVYTVRDGKMYIRLSKKLPAAELDQFIEQYELQSLGIKSFIKTGSKDSILLAGWELGFNNASSFTLTKPLFSFDDINDPGARIVFMSKDPPPVDAAFPSVSNSVQYGYNRFRNKNPFSIQDSVVTFFLRNNLKANTVMLAGSFNNWNPEALPMTMTDSGWIARVKLSPGKYWYKFIIDGNWTIDTDNRLNENDGYGNTNSVYYCTNITFRLSGFSRARKVFLAGSFNNWKNGQLAMEKEGEAWILPLYLAEGTHTYRFIVNGQWMADPDNPEILPNEYNDYNSVITIGKPYVFTLEGFLDAKKVTVSGSFNNWRDDELFMRKMATGWVYPYVLGPGNYEYKFNVDGKGIADPLGIPANRSAGQESSTLVLEPNYTFHLKGFQDKHEIFLAGDFNDWKPYTLKLTRRGDEWVCDVHLSPGKHLYKFIVDGEWIRDPDNKLWEQNEYNTGNSVLWVK